MGLVEDLNGSAAARQAPSSVVIVAEDNHSVAVLEGSPVVEHFALDNVAVISVLANNIVVAIGINLGVVVGHVAIGEGPVGEVDGIAGSNGGILHELDAISIGNKTSAGGQHRVNVAVVDGQVQAVVLRAGHLAVGLVEAVVSEDDAVDSSADSVEAVVPTEAVAHHFFGDEDVGLQVQHEGHIAAVVGIIGEVIYTGVVIGLVVASPGVLTTADARSIGDEGHRLGEEVHLVDTLIDSTKVSNLLGIGNDVSNHGVGKLLLESHSVVLLIVTALHVGDAGETIEGVAFSGLPNIAVGVGAESIVVLNGVVVGLHNNIVEGGASTGSDGIDRIGEVIDGIDYLDRPNAVEVRAVDTEVDSTTDVVFIELRQSQRDGIELGAANQGVDEGSLVEVEVELVVDIEAVVVGSEDAVVGLLNGGQFAIEPVLDAVDMLVPHSGVLVLPHSVAVGIAPSGVVGHHSAVGIVGSVNSGDRAVGGIRGHSTVGDNLCAALLVRVGSSGGHLDAAKDFLVVSGRVSSLLGIIETVVGLAVALPSVVTAGGDVIGPVDRTTDGNPGNHTVAVGKARVICHSGIAEDSVGLTGGDNKGGILQLAVPETGGKHGVVLDSQRVDNHRQDVGTVAGVDCCEGRAVVGTGKSTDSIEEDAVDSGHTTVGVLPGSIQGVVIVSGTRNLTAEFDSVENLGGMVHNEVHIHSAVATDSGTGGELQRDGILKVFGVLGLVPDNTVAASERSGAHSPVGVGGSRLVTNLQGVLNDAVANVVSSGQSIVEGSICLEGNSLTPTSVGEVERIASQNLLLNGGGFLKHVDVEENLAAVSQGNSVANQDTLIVEGIIGDSGRVGVVLHRTVGGKVLDGGFRTTADVAVLSALVEMQHIGVADVRSIVDDINLGLEDNGILSDKQTVHAILVDIPHVVAVRGDIAMELGCRMHGHIVGHNAVATSRGTAFDGVDDSAGNVVDSAGVGHNVANGDILVVLTIPSAVGHEILGGADGGVDHEVEFVNLRATVSIERSGLMIVDTGAVVGLAAAAPGVAVASVDGSSATDIGHGTQGEAHSQDAVATVDGLQGILNNLDGGGGAFVDEGAHIVHTPGVGTAGGHCREVGNSSVVDGQVEIDNAVALVGSSIDIVADRTIVAGSGVGNSVHAPSVGIASVNHHDAVSIVVDGQTQHVGGVTGRGLD